MWLTSRPRATRTRSAVALDLDFGQAGFVEQLGQLVDQLPVELGLLRGLLFAIVCSRAPRQRLDFGPVICAIASIASA